MTYIKITLLVTTLSLVMDTLPVSPNKTKPGTSKKSEDFAADDILRHLAFDNAGLANIITKADNGEILMANRAASKLLGYSKKELLTKNRSSLFNINETTFKKVLKERTAEGRSSGIVTVTRKNGQQITCELVSVIFAGKDGIPKAITIIKDLSETILLQKDIDAKKEIIVADNIKLAKSKQKSIDTKKEKKVADNIMLAKSKQKSIDTKKEKIVADNIILAKSKQKSIDTKKEKIVAGDILEAQEKSDARSAGSDKWIKHIAKASYDVMWDWDIITGKVYVGDSIEEVFGYKVKNNTINFEKLKETFLTLKESAVEKNVMDALSSGSKTWSDSYEIKRFDGSVAAVTSRASIVRDEAGKAIRLIGATQDVSKLRALEKELELQAVTHGEDRERFILATKLSFDVIWDWDIVTGELFIGEGFEELFGYHIENNKGDMLTDWGNHLHPDDAEDIAKELRDAIISSATHWEHAYRVFRADGSIAKVYVRATIMRHANGMAYRLIGAMQDLSRQKDLEEKLEQEIITKNNLLATYKENSRLVLNSSSDILFDSDLATEAIIISDGYEKEFGYKVIDNIITKADWASHLHPDDREATLLDYQQMLDSEELEWKFSYRYLRADNTVANILSKRILLRNADGKVYRLLGSMQNISKQVVLEERLAQEIQLKETQIAAATQDAKETERCDIGRELHDNVNQLLGASRLYLDMAKRGGSNSEMYLGRSSEYTMTAIEEIRKLTKGLTSDIINDLGICNAIQSIATDIMEINPVNIVCTLDDLIENRVNNKFKLNVFRIVQEQLNNVLKYAQATEVSITLSQNKGFIILGISDNGVGFDTAKKSKGIGLDNIRSRAEAYKGNADFISQPGEGCVLKVTFPVEELLLNKS